MYTLLKCVSGCFSVCNSSMRLLTNRSPLTLSKTSPGSMQCATDEEVTIQQSMMGSSPNGRNEVGNAVVGERLPLPITMLPIGSYCNSCGTITKPSDA